MRCALPRPSQSRIVVLLFVNRLTVQICDPRFDVPGGYKYQNVVPRFSYRALLLRACTLRLCDPSLNTFVVTVYHRYERSGYPPATVFYQLSRKPVPYKFLGGTSALWGHLNSYLPGLPTGLDEESSHERLLLLVFTQQDNMNFSAHSSQPLAMSSESLSPSVSAPT